MDRKWVLTAAHCVSGSISTPVVTMMPEAICPLGNNDEYGATIECEAADAVIPSPDWTGTSTGDMQHDYALIKLLTTAMGDEYGWMPISVADQSIIADCPSRNLGYPATVGNGLPMPFGQACAVDNGPNQNAPQNPTVGVAADLYGSIASVIGWTAGRIKTDHDASGGNSGGPIYYCPYGDGGACGAGDQEFLVGLMTGLITGVNHYNGGPKHHQFGDWARQHLPNQ